MKNYIKLAKNLYRERYKLQKDKIASELSSEENSIIQTLKTDGIVVLPEFYSKEFCHEIIDSMDLYLEKKKSKKQNYIDRIFSNQSPSQFGIPCDDLTYYWIDKHGADERIIHAENISSSLESNFSNNPVFLKIGEHFLSQKIELKFTMANRIKFIEDNLGSGGGWHRDKRYKHGFKTLVYLKDVEDNNGPFEYLKQTFKTKNFLIDFPELDKYQFTSEEIQEFIKKRPSLYFKATAPAGSVVIFNTNAIHRGMPILDGERYAATNYYDRIDVDLEKNTQ